MKTKCSADLVKIAPLHRGKVLGCFVRYTSVLDGAPCIMVINVAAANPKTGYGLQTWYLREDTKPSEAISSGLDASVCGQCIRRHFVGGDCYVNVARAPNNVWRSYKAGKYREIVLGKAPDKYAVSWLRSFHYLRLGAYGDPLSAPIALMLEILRLTGLTGSHTGYTHLWRGLAPDQSEIARRYLMASCDSVFDEAHALALGWSCFTATPRALPIAPQTQVSVASLVCPSERTNKRITCAACLKCTGAKPTKLLAIRASEHGVWSKSKQKRAFTA